MTVPSVTDYAAYSGSVTGCVFLFAENARSTTTAGNIATALQATPGNLYQAFFDTHKWYVGLMNGAASPIGYVPAKALASASTIVPTGQVTHLTGASTVQTITPPPQFAGRTGCLDFIVDTTVTTAAGGNIAPPYLTAAPAGLHLACYDASTWTVQ